MSTTQTIRTPTFTSQRRIFEQKLSELHKCSNLHHVKQLHAQIYKSNLHRDPYVVPKLIAAFSRCGEMNSAVNVFNQIQNPNVLVYNMLIRAHVSNSSNPLQAFNILYDMRCNDVWPDNFTYPFLLKACCCCCNRVEALRLVEMVHAHIVKYGFCSDIFVPNALIDSYSKCGAIGIRASRKVFVEMGERDVVSWNTLICGLVKAGEMSEARRLFDEMPERDAVSWNTILDGYAKEGEMNIAFELFEKMPERNVVSWSTLVSGYSKVGDMDMARMLFDKMPVKNLVPWTIIISGYAEKGMSKEANQLYDRLEAPRLKYDDGNFMSILAACADSGMLGLGKRVHASIERTRYKCSTRVLNALVDMYAKCGEVENASSIFNSIPEKDLVSWNAMLQGLAMHGHGDDAIELFSRMKIEGFRPDKVTFVGVLCACTHAGYVEKGLNFFYAMEKEYGITPLIEHYGCMIDLLGRAGRLTEAFRLIQTMPIEPNAIIWGTLLAACRMHNAVELAKEVIDRLVKLEPSDPGNFSVISNIYAAAGHWNNVADARLKMKSMGVQKPSGASSIELDNEFHEFTVFDMSHPKHDRIYHMIDKLGYHLKQVGYIPNSIHINGISSPLPSIFFSCPVEYTPPSPTCGMNLNDACRFRKGKVWRA